MGLFDFFKSFGKEKELTTIVNNPIPTIKPEKEVFDSYAEVFRIETANLTGISSSELEEIYKIIAMSEGGYLNMGAYHTKVYDKYFKGRDWAWTEYEKWREQFTKLGRFPTAFQIRLGPVNLETALGLLSVPELKELLKTKNVEFSSKSKKQELILVASSIVDVADEEIVKSKIANMLEKDRHEIYTILMRTISFRSKSFYDYNRAKKAGVKKFEITHIHDSDKEFVDMALKENPNALPPFFPYNLSFIKPIIDGFD